MAAAQFPSLDLELELWQSGLEALAGIDEAGRGCWAGPVAAAAVVLPCRLDNPELDQLKQHLEGVRDSKQMSARQRAQWAAVIKQTCMGWGVGFASNQEIDELGILPATRLSMMRALDQLCLAPQHLLIDALRLPESPLPQTALIKGDAKCLSIAAASILAKTARDAWMMVEADGIYPGYGFGRHKGYGTAQHQRSLEALGACALHRMSFKPLQPYRKIL